MKSWLPVANFSPPGRLEAHFYNIAKLNFMRETEWVIEYFSRRRPSSPKSGSKVGKRALFIRLLTLDGSTGPGPRSNIHSWD